MKSCRYGVAERRLIRGGIFLKIPWLVLILAMTWAPPGNEVKGVPASTSGRLEAGEAVLTLFLAGDVMTGRGIDQIFPTSNDPVLHESYIRDANGYVTLAERKNGPIPADVPYAYVWGDALSVLEEVGPDLRVINLETAITTSTEHAREKGIHYRMHPDNVSCLLAAGIDGCVLANNHAMDWGETGLIETLEVLHKAGIQTVGAGGEVRASRAPTVFPFPGKGRVLVFAYGLPTSGVPIFWASSPGKPGLNILPDVSERSVVRVKGDVTVIKQARDIVVASLHWGGNWGYGVSEAERGFAHRLIDEAGVDVVYGHSSHHPKGIEMYKGRLILYGAGDFLNDYEGIAGYDAYHPESTLMYFPSIDPDSGTTLSLRMRPMEVKRFQTVKAGETESRWLERMLRREGRILGTDVLLRKDGFLELFWQGSSPAP